MTRHETVLCIAQDRSHVSHRSLDTSLSPRFISIRGPDFSIIQFVSSRGNEYYCEIDEDYLTDRFNLTGLNTEVQYYQYALDLVTDVFDMEVDDDMREQIEKSARHLYGLVHARYIVTTRGLAKMVRCIAFLLHQYQLTMTTKSSTSTSLAHLVNALASFATNNIFYPWAFTMSLVHRP
jgi:hypothetical protein